MPQSYAFLVEKPKLRVYHIPKDPEETSDFALRPPPVFGRKSEQGEIPYFVFSKNLHNVADVFGTSPVSLKTG